MGAFGFKFLTDRLKPMMRVGALQAADMYYRIFVSSCSATISAHPGGCRADPKPLKKRPLACRRTRQTTKNDRLSYGKWPGLRLMAFQTTKNDGLPYDLAGSSGQRRYNLWLAIFVTGLRMTAIPS